MQHSRVARRANACSAREAASAFCARLDGGAILRAFCRAVDPEGYTEAREKAPDHRRVADQGADDQEVLAAALRREGVGRPRARSAEEHARRRRGARLRAQVPDDQGKGDIIKELKSAVKGASEVYLATDPDREGEAIAWHLAELLKLENPKRIELHEITKDAALAALKDPHHDRHGSRSTRSRRGASSTGWSATRSRRCSGPRSAAASRPGACSRSRCG